MGPETALNQAELTAAAGLRSHVVPAAAERSRQCDVVLGARLR